MSAAVWACVGRFQHLENYPAKATWAAVLPPVACGGKPFQALPNRKAASPSRFLVRKSLAVANSHQPCSHGKFRIFRLLWLWACCSQFLCHFGKCKAKLNVAFQMSGMKSVFLAVCRLVKLEKSEFDCSLCKGCVVVQHMVSAVVVMLISAVVCTV